LLQKIFFNVISGTSGENREAKSDSVMMGRVNTLLTPISEILFLLGGCVALVGV
jgi:hypothetical protein